MRERIEIETKLLAGYRRRRFVVVRTPRPKQPVGNYTYRYFLMGAGDTLHEEKTESAIRRFIGIPPLTKFDRKYFNDIWDGVADAKAARAQYGREWLSLLRLPIRVNQRSSAVKSSHGD